MVSCLNTYVWVSPHEGVQYSDTRSQRLRIALYSHDTMGLGHMRRNLLIAHALAQSPLHPVILMINGAYEVNTFTMPPGVDCLSLPALLKETNGEYKSRCLDISLQELITLRSNAIHSALEAFEPDVLIVDKVPRGAHSELDPALKSLRSTGRTRCVLGLRDVLDDPATVQSEWSNECNEDAIREYYDAIWVYGDPAVYDLVHEYRLSPDIASKVRYTGYFDQRMRLKLSEGIDPLAGLPPDRLILCLVGGGQDGTHLAEAFAHADLPPATSGIILTGPFMSHEVRQHLRFQAANNPRLRVLDFINEPALLIDRADRIIAMGGYNTMCEVLSFKKRALIVPRVRPRIEQMIRAECMRDLGLIDVLHPDELSPEALAEWMACDLPPMGNCDRIDLNGLERIPFLLCEVIQHAG
ncbi:putative glycosyl transferase [Candidatus Methanoperedens nitroreducens]|uniref:Putative glycosyl transferase n=1 Tax=Candidatus Methanoperedens nitratireducens TaxID=1392998 RepID=A0A062VA78_9EURY|nr:glycosyltransferase [Candidatus Methanoperedens nitroreducens]KCZ73403.1 putative glycosyl transferase [Candidatus Methanoperedens nitroreducens]MDJ1422642.1 glycosyltransferase [Candidatus Methanoperedens sp.]